MSNFILARATALVALLTLASRLIGLIRVRVYATTFGAGELLDTYYAAFRIPDLLMGIFIVGTLSLAVLPVLAQLWEKDRAAASVLISRMLTYTGLVMTLLCGVAALVAPWLVRFVAPGLEQEAQQHMLVLTRIILIAQIILSVSTVLSVSLQATQRFFWAGVAPILYNAGLIAGVLWLYPVFGYRGLGYGVLLGAVFHALCQAPSFYRTGFNFSPRVGFDTDVQAVSRLYMPRLFAVDLAQVSFLLASIFGSYLASGSISAFALGFDIQAMPVGVVAFAVATVVFAQLSIAAKDSSPALFVQLLYASFIRIFFYILPAVVVLLLLRAHIVRLLYGAGQFTWEDTRTTFAVLGGLAFSLLGQSLIPVLSRACLARRSRWAPIIANMIALVVICVVTILALPGFGITGVAFGYAAGVTTYAIALYVWLRADILQQPEAPSIFLQADDRLFSALWRIMLSTFAFAVLLYGGLYVSVFFFDTQTWLGLAGQTAVSLGIASFGYFGMSIWLGAEEAVSIRNWLYSLYALAKTRWSR